MKNCVYILLFLIVGCSTDNSIEQGELSDELLRIMMEASPTGSLDYFKIPHEDDLDNIPQDPLNPLSINKVKLGSFLFHETGLGIKNKMTSGKGKYSCASCHHAGASFQAGVSQGIGEGGWNFGLAGEERNFNPAYPLDSVDVQAIRTPTVLNAAFQTNMLWNGQFGATAVNEGTEENWTLGTPKDVNFHGFEGIESQAIAGMGVHRLEVNEDLITELGYLELFDDIYGDLSKEERYTNITASLAIAAYERTVLSSESPFQKWLKGEEALSTDELKGAALFFTDGNCNSCHTGPALN